MSSRQPVGALAHSETAQPGAPVLTVPENVTARSSHGVALLGGFRVRVRAALAAAGRGAAAVRGAGVVLGLGSAGAVLGLGPAGVVLGLGPADVVLGLGVVEAAVGLALVGAGELGDPDVAAGVCGAVEGASPEGLARGVVGAAGWG